MTPRLLLILALVLVAVGAVMVLTEAWDLYQAREFWRAMRRLEPVEVPDYWNDRWVMAELTVMTPKVIGGSLVGLAGLVLAWLGLRARRHRPEEG